MRGDTVAKWLALPPHSEKVRGGDLSRVSPYLRPMPPDPQTQEEVGIEHGWIRARCSTFSVIYFSSPMKRVTKSLDPYVKFSTN